MYFDYLKEVFKIESYVADKFFFTYQIKQKDFYVIDVFVKPDSRNTKAVARLYQAIVQTVLRTNCEFYHACVKRDEPYWEKALRINMKLKMKITHEEGKKIFLKGDVNEWRR